MGWQRLVNGQLLNKADGRFDVLVTMDKAMPSQQILARYSIALGIIKAQSNRIATGITHFVIAVWKAKEAQSDA